MRPILALAILLLGLKAAAPESKIQDSLLVADASLSSAPVEVGRPTGDLAREIVLAIPDAEPSEQAHDQGEDAVEPPEFPAPAGADVVSDEAASESLDALCNALLTSAENNDLPVPFFANLIWQESRLRHDAVSPVGALGIAQFMPRVARAAGVGDPFDPRQAIPASARLLRALRDHFGNLGFVAAAYNAGARRVSQWLDHHRALPRQTRTYVERVTGLSVEEWRKTPPNDSALTFVRRLPCRQMPGFVDVEQARLQRTRQEAQTQPLAQAQPARQPPPGGPVLAPARQDAQARAERQIAQQAEKTLPHAHRRVSGHKHARGPLRFAALGRTGRTPVRSAALGKMARNLHRRREAAHHQHPARARRRIARADTLIADRMTPARFPVG